MKKNSPFFKFVDHKKIKALKKRQLYDLKKPKALHLKDLKTLRGECRQNVDAASAEKLASSTLT